MNGTIVLFDAVVIAGIIQGIAAAIAVGCYSSNTVSKKLLSALLLGLALLSFKILLHTLDLWKYSGLRYFPLAIDTLIQPLFYLYTCSLTGKNFFLHRRQFLHFIPFILFQSHATIVYLVGFMQPDIHKTDFIAENYLHYNTIKWIEDLCALFSAAIYWYLSFRKTQRYRKWLFTSQSATQYAELAWLRNLLIGTGILVATLFLSSVSSNILQLTNSFLYLEFFYVYLTGLIYFLSFQGYLTLFTSEAQTVRAQEHRQPPVQEVLQYPDDTDPQLLEDEGILLTIQTALMEIMEKQQLFLEPELTIKEIAAAIRFPAAQVSLTINAKFGMNFRSWVNSYRVEEVKKRLTDPAYKHLSLTGIAFDCGFNSEASFYRIFKKHTGYSPKIYLQNLK